MFISFKLHYFQNGPWGLLAWREGKSYFKKWHMELRVAVHAGTFKSFACEPSVRKTSALPEESLPHRLDEVLATLRPQDQKVIESRLGLDENIPRTLQQTAEHPCLKEKPWVDSNKPSYVNICKWK